MADARLLPFPDESFDLVYSRFLIESMPEMSRTLSEIMRVCRSGGKLLLQDVTALPIGQKPDAAGLIGPMDRAPNGRVSPGRIPFAAANICSLLRCFGIRRIHLSIERDDELRESVLFTLTGTKL
jgi:SAM-dependent methyltransferase